MSDQGSLFSMLSFSFLCFFFFSVEAVVYPLSLSAPISIYCMNLNGLCLSLFLDKFNDAKRYSLSGKSEPDKA